MTCVSFTSILNCGVSWDRDDGRRKEFKGQLGFWKGMDSRQQASVRDLVFWEGKTVIEVAFASTWLL